MNKKMQILDAAVRVIKQERITQLTIEKVCEQASISKGGFLYHFPTKDHLLQELGKYSLDEFRLLLNHYLEKGFSYSESYLYATMDSLDSDSVIVFIALSSYQNNSEYFEGWNDFYIEAEKKLKEDTGNVDIANAISLISDGLWYREIFDFATLDKEAIRSLCTFLLTFIEKKGYK